MKVICSWCNNKMNDKPGSNPGISHGICDSCKNKMIKQRAKTNKETKHESTATHESTEK